MTHNPKEPATRVDSGHSLETIGPLLTRLRVGHGLSQLQVAARLCGLSGRGTVTRHEVSRWEREERVPSPHWRGWLAAVLDVPLEQLEAAVARTRPAINPAAIPGIKRAVEQPQVWQEPTADQLLAALDLGRVDVRGLAHAWLAGRTEVPGLDAAPPAHRPPGHGDGDVPERIGNLEARLGVLRRQDDLAGGRNLVRAVDRELRGAIAALRQVRGGEERRRVLRMIAGYAQLTGWVRADAGDDAAAGRAYRVALQAAAVAGDRDLAGYVLSSLSHLSLVEDAPEALLLAQSGYAGVRNGGSLLTRALLLHRVGERRTAEVALGEADQLAAQADPRREPAWLYWLAHDELAAMTGRCLAVLGRPLRAVRLLRTPRTGAGPRSDALYGVWLARSYINLGEVEEACRVAGRALVDAAASGSTRAADALRHLHPVLVRYGRVSAVREYERQLQEVAPQRVRSRGRTPQRRGESAKPEPVKAAQTPGAAANRSPAVPMGIRYTRGPGVDA